MDSSIIALLTVLVTNAIIAVALYIVFLIVHNRIPYVYHSRKHKQTSLDSILYVKYLETSVILFTPIAVVCLAILLPLNIVNQRELQERSVRDKAKLRMRSYS